MKNIDIMMCMRKTSQFYYDLLKPVCGRLDITQPEAHVIAFLHHNPDFNTASDICEYRMLKKSSVSVAVESLIGRGWLMRTTDSADRRVVRLFLTDAAAEAADALHEVQRQYFDRILTGLSPEERSTLYSLLRRIARNVTGPIEE